jgi:hypothetical protein
LIQDQKSIKEKIASVKATTEQFITFIQVESNKTIMKLYLEYTHIRENIKMYFKNSMVYVELLNNSIKKTTSFSV